MSKTDTQFVPVNSSHSIVETVFFCELEPALTLATLKLLRALEYDSYLKEVLPEFKATTQITMGVQINQETGEQQQIFSSQDGGFERKKVNSENGNLEWLLKVTNQSISVHCLDYKRWNTIWPIAKKMLYTVIQKIGTSESIISSIGLKYIDRYTHKGTEKDNFDFSLLFQLDNELINANSFKVGPRWHCHTGWFTKNTAYECLNQLNIDSTFGQHLGEKSLISTIEHTMSIRDVTEDLLTFTGTEIDKDTPLNSLMEYMHQNNKKVLSLLLAKPMQSTINLSVQPKESAHDTIAG